MSEVAQTARRAALDDAKNFAESSDFAKHKITFALRILSNASNRFAEKCDIIAGIMDKLPSEMRVKLGKPASGQCEHLKAILEGMRTGTDSSSTRPPEAFDVGILRETNRIYTLRSKGSSAERLDNPELYQFYLSRALRMRKMLSGMALLRDSIAEMIDTIPDSSDRDTLAFKTSVAVIKASYVDKIVSAMEARYNRLSEEEAVESASIAFEETLKEIQVHYQNVERIVMNLTIVQQGLQVLEPFLALHNTLAGTLGVPVWYGTDEEWDATKLHKVVKGNKWRRMESTSGFALDDNTFDDEPFRLNPYHTYLLHEPQATARDFSQAMDEARRYLQQVLQGSVKTKTKTDCKTKEAAPKVEYVFVDMNAMKQALASRRGGRQATGDDAAVGTNPAPFPLLYRPPVHLTPML